MLKSVALHERAATLDDCDGYVVLMIDPITAAIDAHGPYTGFQALHDAEHRRTELDSEGLTEVAVTVVRLHHPMSPPLPLP